MIYEELTKDLEKMLEEKRSELKEAQKKIAEINGYIKLIEEKKKDMLKSHSAAEAKLQGHSVEKLQEIVSEILRSYTHVGKTSGTFSRLVDFWGTDEIDIEKLIMEKHVLNVIISVAGGKLIADMGAYIFGSGSQQNGVRESRNKRWIEKMFHPNVKKAIAQYITTDDYIMPKNMDDAIHRNLGWK